MDHSPGSRIAIVAPWVVMTMLIGGVTASILAVRGDRRRPVPPGPIHMATARGAVASAPVHPPPQPTFRDLPANQLGLIFRAHGRSYLKLADFDGGPLPPHGGVTILTDERQPARDPDTALAALAPEALPPTYRAWSGRRVVVDGACTASVVGFVLATRMTGEHFTANVELAPWDPDEVFTGEATVIAAELDGCDGVVARDAAWVRAVELVPIDRPALAAAARKRLISSDRSREVQRDWDEINGGTRGQWYEHPEAFEHGLGGSRSLELTARTLRNPVTGQVWVLAHAVGDEGCGGVGFDWWQSFRLDGRGELESVDLSMELGVLDRVFEVDGALQFLGSDRYLETPQIVDTHGTNLSYLREEHCYGVRPTRRSDVRQTCSWYWQPVRDRP